MPDFTLRVLTFIKVSFSDYLLTRWRLCIGDNAGQSLVGPQRRLKIIRPRENRKAAWCSGDTASALRQAGGGEGGLGCRGQGGHGEAGLGVGGRESLGMVCPSGNRTVPVLGSREPRL